MRIKYFEMMHIRDCRVKYVISGRYFAVSVPKKKSRCAGGTSDSLFNYINIGG
jgi:hypothetical protein